MKPKTLSVPPITNQCQPCMHHDKSTPDHWLRRCTPTRVATCQFTSSCGYNNVINHPWLGMVNIPTIYGDDWGIVHYCCTHITGIGVLPYHQTHWSDKFWVDFSSEESQYTPSYFHYFPRTFGVWWHSAVNHSKPWFQFQVPHHVPNETPQIWNVSSFAALIILLPISVWAWPSIKLIMF